MTLLAPSPELSSTAAVGVRQLSMLGHRWRVSPPSLRDSRLHVSSVILTVHVLGQVWLGFAISIAQIFITLLTCALIEIAVTTRRTGILAWPASALLTAGGVTLVLRVPGTEHGDWLSLHGWYWFVGIGAFSLLTKYVIRRNDTHVFNPSNVGLVTAFLVFGSGRLEPLDLWWGPFAPPMVAAYAVIVGGGLLIGRRLDLLPMAATFWGVLAVCLGALAVVDHGFTARWSFSPVAGAHFWWIVMTSPEVLIFLFFMITDPRTVPAGRVARMVFAAAVAVTCSLFMAPASTEFGVKVGLLAGLVVVCVARPVFDRHYPEPGATDDDPKTYLHRMLVAEDRRPRRALRLLGATGIVLAALLALGGSSASTPALRPSDVAGASLERPAMPVPTVDPEVASIRARLATPAGASELADALAFGLAVEAEALRTGDAALLDVVDHGARLAELRDEIVTGNASGRRIAPVYSIDSLHLIVVFPGGFQSGANAGFVAAGAVEWLTYDTAGTVSARRTEQLQTTFALRMLGDGRWVITDLLDD